MQVSLNTKKGSFLTIGKFFFSYDTPGPFEIKVSSLTSEERAQFLYNLKRGALLSPDSEELFNTVAPPVYSTLEEAPIIPSRVIPSVDKDVVEKDRLELAKLLRERVPTIKKEAASFRPARIKRLLQMEQETKARKGLIDFLEELLGQHSSEVMKAVGKDDLSAEDRILIAQLSTQLTDVVESEIEHKSFVIENGTVLNPLDR